MPDTNVLSHRFVFHAPYLGVFQLADVDSVFVYPSPPHVHAGQVQLVFQLEGRMEMCAGDQRWEMQPGTRCIVPAGWEHHVQWSPEHPHVRFLDLRVMLTPPSALSAYVQALPAGGTPGDAESIAAAAVRMGALAAGGRRPPVAMLAAEVWSLLALYEHLPEAPEPELEPDDARLRAADVLMREHLAQPLSIEQIAARVDLSPSRLRQLVVEHYGVAPLVRYHQLRLQQARLFLEHSGLSIKEIARACGFRNPNHFSRVFTQWAGCTPTQTRRESHRRRP